MKLSEIEKTTQPTPAAPTKPPTRKQGKGIMSNFDVCQNYGAGICVPMKPHRPCGTCTQFYTLSH